AGGWGGNWAGGGRGGGSFRSPQLQPSPHPVPAAVPPSTAASTARLAHMSVPPIFSELASRRNTHSPTAGQAESIAVGPLARNNETAIRRRLRPLSQRDLYSWQSSSNARIAASATDSGMTSPGKRGMARTPRAVR